MKPTGVLCLSLILLLTMNSAAVANDVVVSFDPNGFIGCALQPAFVLFSLYVIGDEIGDVVGWEIAMVPPASITVSDRIINNGPGVNLGGPDNYIIGLGNCYGTPGADYEFIRYDLVYLLSPPADETLCVTVPDAGGAEQGFLAYVDCGNQVVEMTKGLLAYDPAYEGCAVINPTDPFLCTVGNESRSWGAIKAEY